MPLRPRKLRADILHKNSFHYNQEASASHETGEDHLLKSVTEHCCEWKECRTKFLCSKDLLRHIQDEHLSCLPLHTSNTKLTCQWRKCPDIRCYPARYKLLLHLQRCHCNVRDTEKVCNVPLLANAYLNTMDIIMEKQ